MNSNRFVTSYYYPTPEADGELVVPETNASVVGVPQAYQQQAQQHEEAVTYENQRAFAEAQRATNVQVVEETTTSHSEPKEEIYREPVESTYFAAPNEVPLIYTMQYKQAQTPSVQKAAAQNYVAERQQTDNAAPTLVGQNTVSDNFSNNHIQKPTFVRETVQEHVVPKASIQQRQVNTYARVYSADPSEVSSEYAFNQEDEKTAQNVQDYQTNEYISAHSPVHTHISNDQAVHTPSPTYNSVPQNTYRLNNRTQEESQYISFKNDVQPAYGRNKILQYYQNQEQSLATPTYQAKQKQVPSECMTAVEPVPKSRFQRQIQSVESVENVTPTVTQQSSYEDDKTEQPEHSGAAFQPVSLSAPSVYQYNSLNDLVSCIDINN